MLYEKMQQHNKETYIKAVHNRIRKMNLKKYVYRARVNCKRQNSSKRRPANSRHNSPKSRSIGSGDTDDDDDDCVVINDG